MTNQNAPTSLRAFAARLRACRSFFLTPASQPARFSAARAQGGDAIIVDLESTVSPGDKGRARDAALAYLQEPAEAGLIRVLRINSPRTIEGLRDLLALCERGGRPDAVIIPKCQSADEVRLVAEVLDGPQSAIAFVPMVELARAVFVAHLIADANERVCGLFLGGGDLAADLGAEGSWENLLFARSRIVAAAATTAIAAIDVPYFKGDEAGLKAEASASRKLGMTGKAALHPEQLAVINTLFTPSPEAVTHARGVKAACAAARNGAAPALNGHVIEPAMVREADRVLAIAERTS